MPQLRPIRTRETRVASFACVIAACCCGVSHADRPVERAIPHHIKQADLEAGLWAADQIIEAGRLLFVAKFTLADGVGRPAATGSAFPVLRRDPESTVKFTRGAGPDANSCASCHREPLIGGAGDFAVNVFTGLGQRKLPADAIELTLANERGTPALHGSGLLELLAREISTDLQRIRADAISAAMQSKTSKRVALVSKGIHYGWVTADPTGEVDTSEVDGIDRDLIIKPFGAKGTITSLREFTINAANLHHGMQATERYGPPWTETNDFDQDGVTDELTEGDITALTIFQASLAPPGQQLPREEEGRAEVARGEALFSEIGCATCHPPTLTLNDSVFREPNPFNFEGNLRPSETTRSISVDLAEAWRSDRLERSADGFIVRAMTDFKRHDISDDSRPHLRNEVVFERFIPTELFVTRPLWGCGSTAPYGHRGDLVTLTEVIEAHGGEATSSRKRFDHLDAPSRSSVLSFLQSQSILPPDSPRTVRAPKPTLLPY